MFYLRQKLKREAKYRWKYAVIGGIVLYMLAGVSGSGFAQESTEILPINPVPRFSVPWYLSGEGPPIHIHVGVLERFGENEIVVNDSLIRFSLTAEVTFNSTSGSFDIPPSSFKVGDKVGWELDEDGRLKTLWLLNE